MIMYSAVVFAQDNGYSSVERLLIKYKGFEIWRPYYLSNVKNCDKFILSDNESIRFATEEEFDEIRKELER